MAVPDLDTAKAAYYARNQGTPGAPNPMAMGIGGQDPYAGINGSLPSYPGGISQVDYLNSVYDPSGLNAFKQNALRTGPSSWAGLAQQMNLANVSNSREQGAKQTNEQTAQADDNLAARGGLSSGARERTAQEGAKNYMAMSQDLGRQGNLNSMQIGMNDEQNRIQQLSALPGMQNQQAEMFANANQQDTQKKLDLYNQQMQAWGAGRMADATMNSGKK